MFGGLQTAPVAISFEVSIFCHSWRGGLVMREATRVWLGKAVGKVTVFLTFASV
jgi:hypothetical protein